VWADYFEKQQPTSHPWIWNPQWSNELKRNELVPENAPTVSDLESLFSITLPQNSASYPLTQWLTALQYLGFNTDDSDSDHSQNLPPRVAANGVPLLTWEDLGLTGHSELLLWGEPQTLRQLIDPLSSLTLSRRLFPPALTALLASQGAAPPSPEDEAIFLKRRLLDLFPKIKWIHSQSKPVTIKAGPQFIPLQKIPQGPYSPSLIESWVRCPAKTALERLCSAQPLEVWDSATENAAELGSWLHVVLKDFFLQPDWTNPGAQLRDLFQKHQAEIFHTSSSTDYQNLLSSRSNAWIPLLEHHLNVFEKPLLEFLSQKNSRLLEYSAQATVYDVPLKGRMDRIDCLQSGSHWLWDYKTGSKKGKPLTLLKNGDSQWFIYKYLLEFVSETPRFQISAGGYLNPLTPEKSCLFIFGDTLENETLARVAESAGYPSHFIGDKDDPLIQSAVKSILKKFSETIQKPPEPTPLQNSLCSTCSVSGICGRPWLQEKST
jgi:hypothetical protein